MNTSRLWYAGTVCTLVLLIALVIVPASAATTQLHVIRYANDNITVLNETTVSFQWMESNLPVFGDGVTHYYHQGPVFNASIADKWNPEENDSAILTKDYGAVKGTDVKDLCDLVGGMQADDFNVTLKASDGFSKVFSHSSIYNPESRTGPIIITWYKAGEGYVDESYTTGMRNVMFADTSTNPWGYHVFGLWDMHEAYPESTWYYYQPGQPSTTGLSVQNIDRVQIYTNDPLPPTAPTAAFTANSTAGQAPLSVQFTDQSTGQTPLSYSWDFINDGTVDSTEQNPVFTYPSSGIFTVNLTVTNAGGTDSEVKPGYITITEIPAPDTLFDGTVNLTQGGTFSVTAYNSGSGYTVNTTTPLGALDAASHLGAGFSYSVGDKSYATKGILLLDEIDSYWYNKTASLSWICQVNGATLDDYGSPATDGLNLKSLSDGDHVNYYFGQKPVSPENATAQVKITVRTGSTAEDWSLLLKGKTTRTVTKAQFEEALACLPSGHNVNWEDTEGSSWGGIPLWVLVGMVDDEENGSHWTFNDALAAEGYTVKVKASDWDTSLASADIARNDGYLVANTLNGTALPASTPGGKPSWPLHLKGSGVFGGQQVGGIKEIELVGIPEPEMGWTLVMEGEITDLITQQEFEQGIVCHHNVTYTDGSGNVWTGVPLWDLVGTVDDIEYSSHWTFNDSIAAGGYTIRVLADDGFNATFTSTNVGHNDGYILANTLNGGPLGESDAPLKLVGPATASGKERISNVARIRLEGLPSYADGEYTLSLKGKISDLIQQEELEEWIECHGKEYTDSTGNVYYGIPLWRLCGWVDDRIPHGPSAFNDIAASAGYKILVKAGDGYAKEFTSSTIARNENYLIANTLNGTALPTSGSHPPWPLRLVGSEVSGGNSVGNVVEIELTDFEIPVDAAPVHIVKYGSDGITIINETTVSYQWMEANLPVIGDGTSLYKFEAITNNPANLWDSEETYPGGFKISNAVKGTRIRDLCDLVGGMGSGTEIKLIASDDYETTLPYSSIYTNPAVQERQGDAILAWYADGQYVPHYADGMRVFFTPEDHIYGQWDMHETLPETYWHYYWSGGVQFPSCAGLSSKWITTIRIYSAPESDWALDLDGRGIGGINYTVSKTYFEQALACQFGADHKASYTDSQGRLWEGMPLWFLCGFVDDADQHSNNAYNESKALSGYRINITAIDGYSAVFDSRDTIRSGNYLAANTLNGSHIPETDSSWPLRMAGANVTGSKIVKGISSITLEPIEQPASPVAGFSGEPTTGFAPLTVAFSDSSTGEIQVYSWEFGDGGLSSDKNPEHEYLVPGRYTVALTVTGPGGSNTATKYEYITVNRAEGPGSVNFYSMPKGASIYLDGEYIGTTPYKLGNVAAGDHQVVVKAPGYNDYSKLINIKNKAPVFVFAQLNAEPKTSAQIFIRSIPTGARVIIDGIDAGTTPYVDENLSAGSHEIELIKSGYQEWSTTVLITGGKPKIMVAALKRIR